MTDRDLDAYREAYRYSLRSNGRKAPSDDELAALVTGELDPGERDRIALQMLQSPEAMEKHRILEEIHRQAMDRRPSRRQRYQGVGVAAALLLAVSVLMLMPTETTDFERSDAPATSSPSGNIALSEAPSVYQWTAKPGARRYRVQIFDDAANALWQSGWTMDTQILAPGGNELSMPNGARYFWTVEIDGAGASQSLGPYWFRIGQ